MFCPYKKVTRAYKNGKIKNALISWIQGIEEICDYLDGRYDESMDSSDSEDNGNKILFMMF